MRMCPACRQELPPDSRLCPACGASIARPAGEPTGPYQLGEASPSASGSGSPSPPASRDQNGRFTPGALLAGRYRLVTLLGKGGMGEVYRADDLKLGQSVALKFLPLALARDPERLTRFHSEVCIARQVSHPNVCRVYDIGEADGHLFLTMEYIDGQDLAALLRQVGRLPEERGVEIARQLCLGLAAVHDKGVLHRDLKPANVMLDGRGQVRLTDFGLAAFAEQVAGEAVLAGTPAYQAPEVLAGREVTVRSDLYALGLVLYELFTGKRAFMAKSREEVRRLQEEGTPSKPSSHVSGLNAAVERVILRCLEHEAKDRPRSAYEVLAALPGGDPLTAALAAGETPSPRLVADAPVAGTLKPVFALALLATTFLSFALIALLNDKTALFRLSPLHNRPEVMAYQTRVLLDKLGYGTPAPVDTVYGISDDARILRYLQQRDSSPARWDALPSGQPAVRRFWYRQSPRHLTQRLSPTDPFVHKMPGRVTPTEPALDVPGMVTVFLDIRGRLIGFLAVPPARPGSGQVTPVDWQSLFEAAGLDLGAFNKAPPRFNPPVGCDERATWVGVYPDQPGIPLRVDAAAAQGKVVYFSMVPDDLDTVLPQAAEVTPDLPGIRQALIAILTFLGPMTGAVWLAWRNWRLGRANRAGAWRLGVFVLATQMLAWVFLAHHTPSFGDEYFGLFAPMLGRAITAVGFVVLIYLALEPLVRRRWPWRIVGWNRVLEGRFRDPLVGRDLLVGVLCGAGFLILDQVRVLTSSWLGMAVASPQQPYEVIFASNVPGMVCMWSGLVMPAMAYLFLLLILVTVCRREWLGNVAWVLLWPTLDALSGELSAINVVCVIVSYALQLMLLLRAGFLAFTVSLISFLILFHIPLTLDLSAWYAPTGLTYLLVPATVAVYGCVISMGRGQLFATEATAKV